VSTANAVCLRGATPVFVDVRADTLNIDENLISDAVTTRTKAICPVHYAGVSCAMDTISEIAKVKRLEIFEDGAQALGSTYKGEPLGQWSDLF
ncbi:DegT/DnrJ/EryC1/StrS family aminotransferase, partial [Shewanella algae]|uniref:DegT/DnrJ/EryC1/StrS family aminotransferase n=1 Tax=Shewanella algae TaxID=38313 RepID=UPI00313C73F2